MIPSMQPMNSLPPGVHPTLVFHMTKKEAARFQELAAAAGIDRAVSCADQAACERIIGVVEQVVPGTKLRERALGSAVPEVLAILVGDNLPDSRIRSLRPDPVVSQAGDPAVADPAAAPPQEGPDDCGVAGGIALNKLAPRVQPIVTRMIEKVEWQAIPTEAEGLAKAQAAGLPHVTHVGIIDLGGGGLRVAKLSDGDVVVNANDINLFAAVFTAR
jgi:hypothetical protein